MADILERPRSKRARRRKDRALRSTQHETLAALRPSQRRAAQDRAARSRQSSIEYWLRRLTRP